MNIGLIVRCDNRGLANQTWEVYRHIPYVKVLVVRDPGSEKQGFEPHVGRFPDGKVVYFDRYGGKQGLPKRECLEFLEGLDVVYSAETYYDWGFCDWARQLGVKTVLHVNPEFYFHWRDATVPKPDVWWSATNWRMSENMPPNTRVVQMPVPVDRWDEPDLSHNPRRVLHIGGLEAIRDRNGTNLVTQVAESFKDIDFLVNLQDKRKNKFLHRRNLDDYWELYNDESPIMLLPRRYGGLCLPAIEAIGSGKLVVMPDVEPNRMWPIYPVPAAPEPKVLTTQGGDIRLFEADVVSMVSSIKHLFDSGEVEKLRMKSYEWARNNSWDAKTQLWLDEFSIAVGG